MAISIEKGKLSEINLIEENSWDKGLEMTAEPVLLSYCPLTSPRTIIRLLASPCTEAAFSVVQQLAPDWQIAFRWTPALLGVSSIL